MKDFAKEYRPMNWEDLVGQSHVAKTLKKEIETNSISHAYLLTGPRGTGKTTTARILARNLDANVIEMDGASNNGVEDIRKLREDVQYLPTNKKKYKIYIIDECHMISNAGQNVFLKTLEEPPAHVIFVLATTDPQKLLPTIKSRCQCFNLRRISQDDIVSRLAIIANKENIKFEYEALQYIAKSVDGGMRDAIKLLQKCSSLDEDITVQTVIDALGSVNIEHLQNTLKYLLSKDLKNTLIYFEKLVSEGTDIKVYLANMITYITDQMSIMIVKDDYSIKEMMVITNELVDLLQSLRNNQQVKTLTELRFIKLCKSTLNDNAVKDNTNTSDEKTKTESVIPENTINLMSKRLSKVENDTASALLQLSCLRKA